ncbi:acetyl-CoA carboxylase biotin carboxylase subunit family protein [Streptomyces sp. NPDC051567]|uniref:acetyl-CoA carboxylase biotin carboxylase subunit family protein n=1 Tax=Streptomyces sp. NPDC051567 TaxID=3365660 RepID=UPI0037B2F11D
MAPSSSSALFLVLNTKSILDRLPEWFPDAGQELIVVTTRSALGDAHLPSLARKFRHLHLVEDFDGPGTEDELTALGRRFAIRRVLSTGERDVLRAARLRQRLGLEGQSLEQAVPFRDKYVMKSRLARAGMPVAPMRRLTDARDLRAFACDHGFPLVVKQVDSGGSNGTRVLVDEKALAEFLTTWQPHAPGSQHLVEGWVEGDFYQVNGLMEAGRIVLGQPSLHPYSDWFSVAFDAPGMSAMMPEEHPLSGRLRRTAADVLAALPAVPGICAFQVEFFHTPDDRLVICEAACRAGGSHMVDTHEAVLGVNLHGASLLGQAGRGEEVRIGPTGLPRRGYARFPPADGTLRYLPRHCPLPGTLSYRASGEVGRTYEGARHLGPSVADVVFTLSAPDPREELRRVEDWWERNVVWEGRTTALPKAYRDHPLRALPRTCGTA